MKNVLKLSLLTVGIALSSSVLAQEEIKKDAAATATQLEAPSKTTPASDSKQDPAKGTTSTGTAAKKDAKSDTTKTEGGTRMAISEQGMPKKKKNKKAAPTPPPPPAEPVKK